MVQETAFSVEYGLCANAGEPPSGEAEHDSEEEEANPRTFVASAEALDTMTRRFKECVSQFGRLEGTVDR